MIVAPWARAARPRAVWHVALAAGVTALAGLSPTAAAAQQGASWTADASRYHTHARLTAALESVRRANPSLVTVEELARSPGGRTVHAVRLGAGATVGDRPALLILANAYGPHLVGSEIALDAIRRLAGAYGRDTAITALLDRVTIYVLPRLNPDAAEAAFRRPLHERLRNEAVTDDDNDGTPDDDGPADVNGDGVITMMRVTDPTGDWMADPDEPMLMRRADRAKGERGTHRVMVESRDADKDGQFAEDPEGGTDISINFTNGYEFFADGAGDHQFSADESRAVVDFYLAHPNIAAVYVLGAQDNLMRPWEHRRVPGIGGNPQGTSAGGPYSAILAEDEPYFAEVSRRFKATTGLTGTPLSASLTGDPASHAYYDMGRFVFASRGWWPVAPADTTRRAAGAGAAAGGAGGAAAASTPAASGDASMTEQRAAVRWLRANRPDGLIAWTPVQHPDFPGQTVEVGGFHPFARWNPPAAQLDSVTGTHARFIQQLAGMLPQIAIRDVRVARVSDRVFRVTAHVGNDGYLPTLASIGARARWPQRVRLELDTRGEIASGRKIQMLGAIAGSGATEEVSWLVVGDPGSSITVRASSPVAGTVARTVTLQGR